MGGDARPSCGRASVPSPLAATLSEHPGVNLDALRRARCMRGMLRAPTPRGELAPGRARRWQLAIAAAALAWAAVVFAAFHPGVMSIDALVHYGQGLDDV